MEIQPALKSAWERIISAAKWCADPANRATASILGGLLLALLFVAWIL